MASIFQKAPSTFDTVAPVAEFIASRPSIRTVALLKKRAINAPRPRQSYAEHWEQQARDEPARTADEADHHAIGCKN